MSTIRRLLSTRTALSESGMAALEFGIFAPLLALLLIGVTELGLASYSAMQVHNAAQAGIIYAAKNGWDSAGISNAVVNASGTSGISATPAPSQFCGCPNAGGVTRVICGLICLNGNLPGRYIQVDASLDRLRIFSDNSFTLPATLTATAIVRQD